MNRDYMLQIIQDRIQKPLTYKNILNWGCGSHPNRVVKSIYRKYLKEKRLVKELDLSYQPDFTLIFLYDLIKRM